MDFRVLGHLEVLDGGRAVPLGGMKQRAVLALLLLNANKIVPVDRIVEELWADPPETASHTVQVYVSQLRKLMGPASPKVLLTRAPGYMIQLDPDEFDLLRFRYLVDEARQDLSRGDPATASSRLDDALDVWRGPALADFVYEPFAQREISRLEELRLAAMEDRAAARLALGRHAELIADLSSLVEQHPLRERLRAQLMLALYRSGRQAEALDAYQKARRVLSEELGIDPSPELKRLHEQILNQDAALDIEQTRVPQMVPEQAAETVHSSVPGSLTVEERKVVTVLFADLIGSTELGGRFDAERLRLLLSDYFSAMASVIQSWEGTVEKFIGDAVMAVFGIPRSHEDDPDRAIHAAIDMQARLDEINSDLHSRYGTRLAMRVGIDSGEVISGGGGDQLMVTGNAVNLAARLQETAQPGEIVIGERTYLAAQKRFVLEPLDKKNLKGAPRPVHAWRVVAPRGIRSDLRSDLVGRRRELSALDDLYRAVIEEARPRIALLLGEPGIGKTRLADELVARAERGEFPATSYRGRCLAYGKGITYGALREVLWDGAGILLNDSAAESAEKLAKLVREPLEQFGATSEERDRVLHALALTAGIPISDNPLNDMSPESIGEELGLAWPLFLSALAAERPVVFFIEDLHWAETPLLDMIEHLHSRSTGKLLIVVTARPEFAQMSSSWHARPGIHQLSLEPLNQEESRALIERLVPRAGPSLRDKLLAAAEGNPFFAQEIVQHLVDKGILEQTDKGLEESGDPDIPIPDTVRALLAARVDLLPPDEKQVLQDASVVGRTFWATPLERMRPDGRVRDALRGLENKGLVVLRSRSALPDQTEFAFNHALTREIAYDSIPKGRRARAHAQVADWIEDLSGDRRDEFVELIAYHYEAAASPESIDLAWPDTLEPREEMRFKALAALLDAGEATRTRYAIDQALEFSERALALAVDDAERTAALELRAAAAHAGVRPDLAWSSYQEALETAGRAGDSEAALRLGAHATLLWCRYAGAFTTDEWKGPALDIVTKGIEAAGEDSTTLEAGAFLLGRSAATPWNLAPYDARYDAAAARRDAERAVEIADAIGSPYLLSYALDALGAIVSGEGFCESAGLAERLLEAAGRMGDRVAAQELLVTAADSFCEAGQFDDAREAADEASRQATGLSPHHRLHAASAQVACLSPAGHLEALFHATEEAADLINEEGGHTCMRGGLVLSARALALYERANASEVEDVLTLLEKAFLGDAGGGPFETSGLFRTVELLRPVRKLDESLTGLSRIVSLGAVGTQIYEARAELPLRALIGEWERVGELAAKARNLAKSACAPSLVPIAELAEAARLAEEGSSSEASAHAIRAAASLSQYGEPYTAARLVLELLPRLEPRDAGPIARELRDRFRDMGALGSVAQAEAYV